MRFLGKVSLCFKHSDALILEVAAYVATGLGAFTAIQDCVRWLSTFKLSASLKFQALELQIDQAFLKIRASHGLLYGRPQ